MRALELVLRATHRRFWLVGAVTVVVCVSLAAKAAGHVVEARYLSDAAVVPPLPRPSPPPAPDTDPAPADRATRAATLVDRNMFCSDCGAGEPEPIGSIPVSSLPLALIATTLGTDPWATVRDTTTGAQGAFGLGDRIPGAGTIERIAGTWIDIKVDAAGRVERVQLLAVERSREAGAAASATGGTASATASAWADRIRKIDDTTVEVDRGLVRELIGSGGAGVTGVRIAPVTKDGKLDGLKLFARPGSLAAELGLKSGDVIQSIDGRRIESAQQLIDMVARLDDLSAVRLEGTRRGQPLTFELRLR